MKVLLSIKPEYSTKIFSGEKKFEFRKQKPKKQIERVFIYESNPRKSIVGWFSIKKILSGSPKEIWEKCKTHGGIEKEKFFEYCNGKKNIFAFEIDGTSQFEKPLNPFEIDSDFKPPQNFYYFDGSLICRCIENKEVIVNDRI